MKIISAKVVLDPMYPIKQLEFIKLYLSHPFCFQSIRLGGVRAKTDHGFYEEHALTPRVMMIEGTNSQLVAGCVL